MEKDFWNYIDKKRRLCFRIGDVKAIHYYFVLMQSKNSILFYMIDVDDNARISNLFWVDARSMVAYGEFFDVITFDTM